MGIKVNILKITLNVSDLDRNYYQEHKYTIAHQPPETGIYVIARILALALNAHEDSKTPKVLIQSMSLPFGRRA